MHAFTPALQVMLRLRSAVADGGAEPPVAARVDAVLVGAALALGVSVAAERGADEAAGLALDGDTAASRALVAPRGAPLSTRSATSSSVRTALSVASSIRRCRSASGASATSEARPEAAPSPDRRTYFTPSTIPSAPSRRPQVAWRGFV